MVKVIDTKVWLCHTSGFRCVLKIAADKVVLETSEDLILFRASSLLQGSWRSLNFVKGAGS